MNAQNQRNPKALGAERSYTMYSGYTGNGYTYIDIIFA
jgi:hypothetical protein